MLLVDYQIRALCQRDEPMIDPFSEHESALISYGLGGTGYDLRLSNEIWVFKNTSGEPVDPVRFKQDSYLGRMFDRIYPGDQFTIPAHGYVLGCSYEYLRIPRGIMAICLGKSTYARCGVVVNTTPAEGGWEGQLTLEIANTNPSPVVIYPMLGIAQMLFFRTDRMPETSYNERVGGGKYQGQTGVTPARVKS